jgi:hypothetical protein
VSQEHSSKVQSDSVFSLAIPIESLRPLVESVLESTGTVPGWPIGRVALGESDAAACVGVKTHVLRDARLRLNLPHTKIGRTVIYTAGQLAAVLEELAANS